MLEEQTLLIHRFYQHWQKGKVTPEVLRSYAVQYYAYESALPKFLEQAMAHLPEGPALESLKDNLADQAGGGVTAPQLCLRSAEALGVSRQEVQEATWLPGTANLVYTYESLCDRGPDEALAAIYAYEAQFPA